MRARIITCGVVIALSMTLRAVQTPTLRITWPPPDAIVGDATRIQAEIAPAATPVESVSFSVNGLLVCTVERPPFGCPWNPGAVRPYHIRVVATLANGQSLVANVRTKDLGYTERARADAVLVPVIVTDRGKFVRGLTRQDFEVFEDGVRQPIASLASEESPLDLVMAMDVSGSMENALDDVKVAVKQFLTKLRPGDAATLVGFNDNMFIAAERETDPATREAAVDLLASWGGTAIYDATVRVLDMVGRNAGRRGVVLFSDGDDQNSMTTRETAMARVQSSDAMLYTIGFGAGVTRPLLRSSLEEYAISTGGRAFFPRHTRELDGIFDLIVNELANQYVLSYSPPNPGDDSRWREISVKVRKGKFDVRARRGYRPQVQVPRGRGGE
jgi:Ca-activated chloride channel homolog